MGGIVRQSVGTDKSISAALSKPLMCVVVFCLTARWRVERYEDRWRGSGQGVIRGDLLGGFSERVGVDPPVSVPPRSDPELALPCRFPRRHVLRMTPAG